MMTLTTGWLPPGAPQREYRPIPAMSASGLKLFRRSARHYRHGIDHPRPPTPALALGRATHTALLEPDRYAELWTVLGQCEGRNKNGARCGYAAKLARDGESFCGRHDPLKGTPEVDRVIKLDDHERLCGMRDAIREHPQAAAFIAGHPEFAEVERSGVFRDPETGAPCKFRPDRLLRIKTKLTDGCVIDLKTAQDASPVAFGKAAANFGYHHQAAMYLRGMAALGEPLSAFVFVAVESDPPHGVACYLVDEHDLSRAHEEVTDLLIQYQRCIERDEWPGYSDALQDLLLPPWAFRREYE